ncbi:hypothetical protein OHA40_20390 [Nocardia sp. NBC_00508]|nr:hypothetical protein [Nocardia sp. NBC_00508]WUD64078.1 hypothetical protein OHA40_20390 [Nocardia sp. NBC_00508]
MTTYLPRIVDRTPVDQDSKSPITRSRSDSTGRDDADQHDSRRRFP